MELWELLQLPRPEIEKMRKDVKRPSAALDTARRKLTEGNITFQYPNAELLLYLENFLRDYTGDDLHPKNLPENIVFFCGCALVRSWRENHALTILSIVTKE